MFTGIIESLGTVKGKKPLKGGIEFDIEAPFTHEIQIDDSICTSGVCLTVVKKAGSVYSVQAVEETLRKTTLGSVQIGQKVNLERCLTPQSRLDGHIVQGHVDIVGTVKSIQNEGANWLITISYPDEFRDLIVGRGSIAVDGISLTIAREQANEFTLAIIPYTWEHTTLHERKVGDSINLEFDILGKYVVRFLQNRANNPSTKGLTAEKLLSLGF
ncbi:riboflavin synthase [bacterium]|nr:MAG: riboflavin synthase [bacterium]